MERKLSWNPKTLQNEIVAADSAVNALFETAKVQAPANAATLAEKIVALKDSIAKESPEAAANVAKISELQASVTSLTAEKTTLETSLADANAQLGELANNAANLNTELSKRCLNFGCVPNLTEADGKTALAADASPEARLAALDRVPVSEKLTLIDGAVTSALNRLNVNANALPQAASTNAKPNTMTRAEFTALTPAKQMAFVKARGKITE